MAQVCAFCGRTRQEVPVMVAGPQGIHICEECVWASAKVVQQTRRQSEEFVLERLPSPAEIKGELDRYIIGQEQAKKTVAVAVYNHYKRITAKVRNSS